MSGRRAAAKLATRAKVLEAAKRCFQALGYERTTMRLIAEQAGMSTGAVFANWTGKAELYRELYGHDPISPERGRELLETLLDLRNRLRRTTSGHTLVISDDALRAWDLVLAAVEPAVAQAVAA